MRLVADHGAASGFDVPLRQGMVSIGTGRGNAVVIVAEGVMSRHTRLRRQGEDWFVEDVSGNPGTYLNGIRVTAPQMLRPGDYLALGAASFRIVAEPSDSRARGVGVPVSRVAWLAASAATFLALAALVVGIANANGRVAPLAPAASAVRVTRAAGVAAAPVIPTASAKPTATRTRMPTSHAAATQPPAAPPVLASMTAATIASTATPDVVRATLREALAAMSIERVEAAETALAGMRPAERVAAVSTLAASPPEAVTSWLDQVLGTPTPVPLTGRLLFARYDRDLNRYDVVRYDLLTGEAEALLPFASQPATSPSGDSVAYRSWQADGLGIHVATADGTQRWLLTREVHPEDGAPDWSPDGLTIAFASMRYGDGRSRIYTVPAVGGDASGICVGDYVAWSPDGLSLAFKSCIGGSCGVMIGAPDGSSQGLLTSDASDGAPAWSPDGAQIAFHSSREGTWDVFVVRSDGTEVRRLTSAASIEAMPVWSPDGRWIAFRSNADGEWGIWAVPVSGGEPRRLAPANVRPGDEIVEGFDWLR